MKRFTLCLLILCLALTACSKPAPAKAADGADWDESWITLGNILGVAEPGNGLVLRDNNDALSVNDMYLASWTIGDGTPYTNEDGDEVVLYPARLDVLVYGRKDEAAARETLGDWTARQTEIYDVVGTEEQTHNGQDYAVSVYTCKSAANPYDRGVSAFGVYGDYAVSAELNCQDGFDGDEEAILMDFLDCCHYAAGEE